MRSFLLRIFRRKADTLLFNVWIPATVAVALLVIRDVQSWWGLPTWLGLLMGVVLTAYLVLHTYLLKTAKEEQSNVLQYWKKVATRYSWLLKCIEKLLQLKHTSVSNPINDPREFGLNSIARCLQMLAEFYIQADSTLELKVVFFVPSPDGCSLMSLHWYNTGAQAPHSHGRVERQRAIFDLASSPTLAVKAWSTRSIQIAENEDEVHENYVGQKNTVKSLVAYPIFGLDAASPAGVITITADKPRVFLRSEVDSHAFFLHQFGIRIALELTRLKTVKQ